MEVAGKVCLTGLLGEGAGSVPEGGGSTQSLRVEIKKYGTYRVPRMRIILCFGRIYFMFGRWTLGVCSCIREGPCAPYGILSLGRTSDETLTPRRRMRRTEGRSPRLALSHSPALLETLREAVGSSELQQKQLQTMAEHAQRRWPM